MTTITVIGAGAWGTALATTLASNHSPVTLYSRSSEVVDAINSLHQNPRYLPDIALPATLTASTLLQDAVAADVLVLTTPSQHLRAMCLQLAEGGLPHEVPLILCCKGIEMNSLKLVSEITAELLPHNPVALLSGPNFADEIGRGLPAATTIACNDPALGERLMQLFSNTAFRPYYSADIIGAQIGGAVKNVLAIGCGILIGKGLGENAKAALITRGLAEIMRLGLAKGGKMETLMGLSGMGDLILTCGSPKSRNMSLGLMLGSGKPLQEILATRQSITEGVTTAKSVVQLAEKLGIEMPICEAVYKVLYEDMVIEDAIAGLLQRPLTREV